MSFIVILLFKSVCMKYFQRVNLVHNLKNVDVIQIFCQKDYTIRIFKLKHHFSEFRVLSVTYQRNKHYICFIYVLFLNAVQRSLRTSINAIVLPFRCFISCPSRRRWCQQTTKNHREIFSSPSLA